MPKSKGRRPSKAKASRPTGRPRPVARPPAAPTPPQPGRRPSPPGLLVAVAAAWIACGVIALVALRAGWRLVPGIVFIGIGLLFLRGAAATVVRRERRRQ